MSVSADESQQTCPKCGAPLQDATESEPASVLFVYWKRHWMQEGIATATHEQFDHYRVAARSATALLSCWVVAPWELPSRPPIRSWETTWLYEDRRSSRRRRSRSSRTFSPRSTRGRTASQPKRRLGLLLRDAKSDNQCFYAMELVEGETLEVRLRRTGSMAPTPRVGSNHASRQGRSWPRKRSGWCTGTSNPPI